MWSKAGIGSAGGTILEQEEGLAAYKSAGSTTKYRLLLGAALLRMISSYILDNSTDNKSAF